MRLNSFCVGIWLIAAQRVSSSPNPNPYNCNANNCLREVRATRFGTAALSSMKADCSSYMTVTVIPDSPTSFTTTTTSTTTTSNVGNPAGYGGVRARDTTLSNSNAIPTYATDCAGRDDYLSACSCAGVTPSTSIVVVPSSTVTATSTAIFGATHCLNGGIGFIHNLPCDVDNPDCFCLTNYMGDFFCGYWLACNAACDTNEDCDSGFQCADVGCDGGTTCVSTDACIHPL